MTTTDYEENPGIEFITRTQLSAQTERIESLRAEKEEFQAALLEMTAALSAAEMSARAAKLLNEHLNRLCNDYAAQLMAARADAERLSAYTTHSAGCNRDNLTGAKQPVDQCNCGLYEVIAAHRQAVAK